MYKNDSNIPITLAVWLAAEGDYDLTFDPNVYSVTDLLKPVKSLILTRQIKAQQLPTESKDLADFAASKLGSAVHTAVEIAWLHKYKPALKALGWPDKQIDRVRINPPKDADPDNPNYIDVHIETRTARKIKDKFISGKFDFVVDGIVRDVKTTKTYTWINGSNNHKFMMQGSLYRWLNEDIIKADYMCIDYAFTDWTPLQAQANKDYPPQRLLEKKLELLPVDVTHDFVLEKLEEIADLEHRPQEEMPLCTPEELWQNPAKWAFYRKATNKTATKLYDNPADAHAANAAIGNTGVVVERKATPKYCTYCDASSICLQADAFRAEGLL